MTQAVIGPQVLRGRALCKSFRHRRVVREVSLEVHPGEIVGLLGPNGAGKTTTFNMLAGLVRPDAGEVSLGTHALGRLPLYRRARLGLGYLPQESTLFRGLTAIENLAAVVEARGQPRRGLVDRLETMLAHFNLMHVRDSLGQQLSGGERRRLEMARALIAEPAVLLLDEPFAGVDPIAVGEIRGFIEAACAAGPGVLLTDHKARETLSICHRAYLIHDGQILFAGTPAELVADAAARRTYLGEDFVL